MRNDAIKWFACVVFCGVLIVACGGTKLTNTKVDEARLGVVVRVLWTSRLTFSETQTSVPQNFI